VLRAIPAWVDDVVVADNGSSDNTASVAESCGARVVHASHRGYGSACLAGIDALIAEGRATPYVVVFLDADFSDHPEQIDRVVDPILCGLVELVIGSRVLGRRERGALSPQSRFGNWLATQLIKAFWGMRFTDLGPFRAIRYDTLQSLQMSDPNYGWTVEMQVKAAVRELAVTEVPVDYRKRVGKSKISGTIRGIAGAGYKILGTILVSAIKTRRKDSAVESHHVV